MTKTTKKRSILVLTFALVLLLCVALTSGVYTGKADAVAKSEDIFIDGAGIYIGTEENEADKSGIRFKVVAKKSVIENEANTVGAILVPADMVTGDKVEIGTENAVNNELASEAWKASESYTVSDSETDSYMESYVYLYNFPASDYNRVILANAYVFNGESYKYAGTVARSMSEVALEAVNDSYEEANRYIKSYNVNFYGADGVTEISGYENVTQKYGEALTEPSISDEKFQGFYADKECTVPFDFTDYVVKGTVNVYSKWVSGEVCIEQTSATLYVPDSDSGNENSIKLSATAFENGLVVEGAVIQWSIDGQDDVVSLNTDGTVTAINAGKVTVKATYTNDEGAHVDSIEVTVLPLQKTVENRLVIAKNRLTAGKYEVDLSEITGSDAELTKGTVKGSDGNVSARVDNNVIDFSSIDVGAMTMVLETRNVVYSVNVELFDVGIKTVDEFRAIPEETTLAYCLESDLDFSSSPSVIKYDDVNMKWICNVLDFCGVLDGNGHNIKGLTLQGNQTGLFRVINGATIKNLNLIDVVMTGKQIGALAYATIGTASTIENVYVSVKGLNSVGVQNANYIGGLIGLSYCGVNVKGCCVYMTEAINSNCTSGYVCGYSNAGLEMTEDCIFIGGISKACGLINNGSIDSKTTSIYTALQAHKNEEELGDFYSIYNENHPHVELNSTNFTMDTIRSLRNEIVELTEDVTLSSYKGKANYIDSSTTSIDTSVVFSGVFEGNGHEITQLDLDGGAIFNVIDGATIKNVKIINATVYGSGTIAYITFGSQSTIKNVYVSGKTGQAYTSGGFVLTMYAGLEISNCCVNLKYAGTANYGCVCQDINGHRVTINDCVFIGDSSVLHTKNSSKTYEYVVDGVAGGTALIVTDVANTEEMAKANAMLDKIGFKETYENDVSNK